MPSSTSCVAVSVGATRRRAACCSISRRSPTAGKERLDILRKTTDGFEIAEADFKLRGPGDLLGLRQSGLPAFRVLDLMQDTSLIETARTDASPS